MHLLLDRHIALHGEFRQPLSHTMFTIRMNQNCHPYPVYGSALACPIDRRIYITNRPATHNK